MPNQEFREPTRSVAIVAPIWRQNVLSLWLQVVGKFELVTCTTTFEVLPFYSRPDLVIFSASSELVGEQVQKIRLMWPETHLVVLADAAQAELQAAGADVVLSKEFSPKQLLNAIEQLQCETVIPMSAFCREHD